MVLVILGWEFPNIKVHDVRVVNLISPCIVQRLKERFTIAAFDVLSRSWRKKRGESGLDPALWMGFPGLYSK